MKIIIILVSIFCFFGIYKLNAQDTIFLKNGDVIVSKIQSTNNDKVVFLNENNSTRFFFKTVIQKVKFSDGKEIFYEKKPKIREKSEYKIAANVLFGVSLFNFPESDCGKDYSRITNYTTDVEYENRIIYNIQLEYFLSPKISLMLDIGSNDYKIKSSGNVTVGSVSGNTLTISSAPTYYNQKHNSFTLNFKYNFLTGKFVPFLFCGLGVSTGEIDGYYTYYDIWGSYIPRYSIDKLFGFPIQAGVGLSYAFNKHLGIIVQCQERYIINSTEIKLDSGGYKAKEMNIGQLLATGGVFLRF